MKRSWTNTLLVCALALGAAEPPAARGADNAWTREAGTLALTQAGKVVWQFNYGTNQTKPCFHPVAVPGAAKSF